MAGSECLTIDKLVLNALDSVKKDATPQQTTEYETQKKEFEQLLFKSASVTDDTEKEVCKIKVNENEEVHTNPGKENKFAKSVTTSGSFNFEQQTTDGLVWDEGINLGPRFLRPWVTPILPGVEYDATKEKPKDEDRIESKGRNESNLTVPPGHKIIVNTVTCRECHEMEYTMQFRVPKSASIQVRHSPRLMGLSTTTTSLTASQLLKSMPNFREDEVNVYFTQKGKLMWVREYHERASKQVPLEEED